MRLLRVFSLDLLSDFPFACTLRPGIEKPELFFGLSSLPAVPTSLQPFYSSPVFLEDGRSLARLFHLEDYEVLSFASNLDFHLHPGRIACAAADLSRAALIEGHLLGPVLSYWLERQGIPTLHASAVDLDGHAVGFLSAQGGGKSGLAAAFVQAGHPLLTDDILPVEESAGTFLGRSGYPQMKMWPDEATHFLGGFEHLPRVHPRISKRRVTIGEEIGGWGRFQETALPLAALYVPERREGGAIEIAPLSRSAAVIELVRQSFSPHLVQAVGLQPARLDLFSRLVRQIPVRRLLYPSGFERLPEVVEAVRRDLSPR